MEDLLIKQRQEQEGGKGKEENNGMENKGKGKVGGQSTDHQVSKGAMGSSSAEGACRELTRDHPSGTAAGKDAKQTEKPESSTKWMHHRVRRTQQQLEQLEKDEMEAIKQLSVRIQIIDKIVREAKNIHKPIRDAITEAVIFHQQIEDYREALGRTREAHKRAFEQACVEAHDGRPVSEEPRKVAKGKDAATQVYPNEAIEKSKITGKPRVGIRRPDLEAEKKKRAATSPPQIATPGKRKCDGKKWDDGSGPSSAPQGMVGTPDPEAQAPDWETVERRAKKRSGNKSSEKPPGKNDRINRPAAVAVKPTGGVSYAHMLRQIKSNVDPGICGVQISGIRRTRGGELLVEIKKGSGGPEKLRNAVANVLGDEATVRTMVRSYTLEIRDLDEVTEEEEVVDAILATTKQTDPEVVKVRSMRKAFGETQIAVVTTSDEIALKLLRSGKVKIGWVLCRVRERIQVVRCFKCQGFGHVALGCKGPDRSKLCRLCGKENHVARECKEEVFCAVCNEQKEDTNHILGSARCPSFQKALKNMRK